MPKPRLLFISLFEIQCRKGRMSEHLLYDTWRGMLERCTNKKSKAYIRYGNKGIKVYKEWTNKERHPVHKRWSKGFCSFLEYVELHLGFKPESFSLDRIDSTQDYAPGNLRWANASLQKKNQKIKNKTGYKYVYPISGSSKWQGEYKQGKERIYVGAFNTKEEAHLAVLAHRLEQMWPKNL
jgi:hypothetical protein